MATVDQQPEPGLVTERGAEPESGRPLQFDESVGVVPIRLGWDAEPTVLDWSGEGRADLLVTSGGGPQGRLARLYRALERPEGPPLLYDGGAEVPGLEGLRCLCAIPNGKPTRFDLIGLGVEGLVLLPNEGTESSPSFQAREPYGVPENLDIGAGRVAQMTAEDWDGDGRTDLLIGFDDLDGYWPDEEDLPREQLIGFNQLGGHPGYDRSGQWRGRPSRGRIFWMRNVSTTEVPHFEAPEEITLDDPRIELGPHPAPLSVAWGGGRACEVLMTDDSGHVRLHRNFGGQRPPVLMEARPIKVAGQPLILPDDRTLLVAADLDADQRVELLYGRVDGRLFAIHSGPGRDSALSPEPILHEGRALPSVGTPYSPPPTSMRTVTST